MWQRLIRALAKPEAIRFQALVALYFNRIYHANRQNYLRNYHSGRITGTLLQGSNQKKLTNKQSLHHKANSSQVYRHHNKQRDNYQVERDGHERKEWDWNGYPELWWPIVYYQYFTTAYMCYAALRELMLLYVEDSLASDFVGFATAQPANCYLLGRFFMAGHVTVDHMNALVIPLFHIGWRLFLRYRSRPYDLSMFSFLLMSERDIQRFYNGSCETPTTTTTTTTTTTVTISRYEDAVELTSVEKQQQQQQLKHVEDKHVVEMDSSAERERFFKSVLCIGRTYDRNSCSSSNLLDDERYSISSSSNLRPNRTHHARKVLFNNVARGTLIICSITLAFILVFGVFIVFNLLDDHRYLLVYPGCDLELQQAATNHQLGWWSFSLRPHRVLAFLADGLDNLVIWSESGLDVLFVSVSAYQLNFDILQYWKHLDARTRALHYRMRAEFELRRQHSTPASNPRGGGETSRAQQHSPLVPGIEQGNGKTNSLMGELDGSATTATNAISEPLASARSVEMIDEMIGFDRERVRLMMMMNRKFRLRLRPGMSGNESRLRSLIQMDLVCAARELRAEFCDFFAQIGQLGLLMSDILTVALILWLSLFALVAHYAQEQWNTTNGHHHHHHHHQEEGSLWQAHTLQVIGFMIFTLMSLTMVTLHNSCLRTYKTLCSLMAYDMSIEKRDYFGVLEFYTMRKRGAYTIFQTIPYTATTYLSIFSWSLTCYFVVESLIKRTIVAM